MTADELNRFLHQHIPAVAALSVSVEECTPQRVCLRAPFAVNQNHKHTFFGGSMSLVATLCAWSFVHAHCVESEGNIVIQEGKIRYLKPALGELTAVCNLDDVAAWEMLAHSVRTRGKGRIELDCDLFSEGILVATFQGRYVAFKPA